MSRSKITVYTRAAEYPNDFRVDDGLLLCLYCNHAVKWEKKSTIKDHIRGIVHCAKKRECENRLKANGEVLQQRTIASTISIANSKKELIEDLIHAFAVADIPLEKVNSLLPFFNKHMR